MNRNIRIGILFGLIFLLVGTLGFAAYYLVTGQPAARLPIVRSLARGIPPHYLFSIYEMDEPRDVAVSPDGKRVYVTETGGERRIRVFDRQGRQINSMIPPDSTPNTRMPLYVATGIDGTVYVSDRLRNELTVYGADGNYLGAYTSQGIENGLAPTGVVVARNGDVLVADMLNERILRIDRTSSVRASHKLKRLIDRQRVYPGDVALSENGHIFVGNSLGGQVDVFDAGGKQRDSLGANAGIRIGLLQGLFVDDDNRLYVVDALNAWVTVVDIGAEIPKAMFSFGSNGIGNGQFRYPAGVAADALGRVYVADRVNNRVQVWSY